MEAFPFRAKGQTAISLTGQLVDSATIRPLAYATLQLMTDDGSVDTVRTYSSEDGRFRFERLRSGEYTLGISWMGQSNRIYRKININDTVPEQDIGIIFLTVSSQALEEVTVLSQAVITQEPDRLVYHVDRDEQQASATIIGIMEKVPLLSVMGDGQIRYLGTSSFAIHVDGKPSAFTSGNIMEFLRSMPATSISKIEVITSPSARYLDEGIEAIINIQTKKRLHDGSEGSVTAGYGMPPEGPGAGVNGAGRFGKTGINVSAGLSDYRNPDLNTSLMRQDSLDKPYYLTQEGVQNSRMKTAYSSARVQHEFNALHLFSLRLSYTEILESQNVENHTRLINNENPQDYLLKNQNRSLYRDGMVGADFQRNFANRADKVLNFSYLYAFWKDNAQWHTVISGMTEEESVNITFQNEHSAQVDYTQDIGSSRLEIGSKWVARSGTSDFDDFRNYQQMAILYASSRYKLGGVNILGGLRYEYTGYLNQQGAEKSRTNFNNLVPNLTVNWTSRKGVTLQSIYMKTIRRPNVSYLNPFLQNDNPQMQLIGNPDLRPVENDNITLQLRRSKKGTFVANLRYAHSRNTIQQLYLQTPESGVARYKMANIGHQAELSLLLSYQRTFFRKLNLNLSGTVKHTELAGNIQQDERIEKSGYNWVGLVSLQYYPSSGWRLGASYQYSTPAILLQGEQNQMPYLTGTASKNFLSDRMTLSTVMVNPFARYFYSIREYQGAGFLQTVENQTNSMRFRVSLLYRLGKLDKSIRDQRKTIQNTDAIGKN